MFKHYLITRFNLKNTSWKTTKNNSSVLTKEWMENRMKLFLNFCLPSVMAQTNKNFEWLVYFDKDTDKETVSTLQQIQHSFSIFKPVFVNDMDDFLPSIKNYLLQQSTPYIITSRIDNDDAIHENYIDEIQKRFNQQAYLALDFVDGFALQTEPIIRMGYKRQSFNPFISLIEKNENAQSVWQKGHSDWKRESKIKTIKNIRIWLQIVHFENKVNEFVAYGNVNSTKELKKFNINKEVENSILNLIIPVTQWKKFSNKMFILSYLDYYFRNLKRSLGFYKLKR